MKKGGNDVPGTEPDLSPDLIRLHPLGPTRGAVVLFIIAIFTAVALVTGGTAYAIITNQDQVNSANQQWCTVLDLLTGTPVSKPPDPKANPSREGQYKLYQDFLVLRRQFGCS